jgi:hypothetical protein
MKWVIVDNRISAPMERSLLKLGYNVLKLPASPALPVAIASHPDTLIFHSRDVFLTTCDYGEDASFIFSDIREFSEGARLYFSADDFGSTFPNDTIFNALVMGDFIFLNEKNISTKVLEIAQKQGLTPVNVNQSYPNCSVLKINEQSAITADRGIYKSLCDKGINTLLISPGHILLPPYEYGFIGGASGSDSDKVMFFGNIEAHPDYLIMRDFIESRGKRCISLSDESLVDLGGMIFL